MIRQYCICHGCCMVDFLTEDACCAGCFCPLMADLLRPFLLGMDQSFKHSYHLIYFIGRLKSGMHLCPSNSFQTHPLPVIHRFTKYKAELNMIIIFLHIAISKFLELLEICWIII
uniref:Uncharacterized protein n=1 Tax=Rhizophora mucronata TaxID=61149 RepID=A0A2P2QMR6_RHIMU